MTRLQELETAVASLPEGQYRQFHRSFLETDWERWDSQIEEDARAGRLDFLVEEARAAKRSDACCLAENGA